MKPMTAKDVMTREVATMSPLTEVAAAAKFLTDRRITGAPVVDGGGRLLGVVSQTDLTRFQANEGGIDPFEGDFEPEPRESTPVIVVMTDKPVTCSEDTPIEEIAHVMLARRIHRVVVTREDGTLCGIVSAMDLLRAGEKS
jgi:CBS domain-containing protein